MFYEKLYFKQLWIIAAGTGKLDREGYTIFAR